MPEVALVTSATPSRATYEFAETVRYELDAQGVPSELAVGIFPEPRPGRVFMVAGPREVVGRGAVDDLPYQALLSRTIVITQESADTVAHGSDAYIALLRRAGVVFTTQTRGAQALAKLGIGARVLRPGHSVLRDNFDPARDRDIDVLFYGAATDRRTRLLSHAAPLLAGRRTMILLDQPGPSGPGAATLLIPEVAADWVERKYALLARSRVVINLHAADTLELEWGRMIEAFHTGAVFVSEHGASAQPFTPGEHLLFGGPESVSHLALGLLDDPAREQRMRVAAHERLCDWLPYALSIGILRAAVVELVGRPLSGQFSAGTVTVEESIAGSRLAVSAPTSEPMEATTGERDDVAAMSRSLASTRRELQRVRARLGVLGLDAGGPRGLVHRSPAWDALRAPEVAVLIASDGSDDRLLRTLESLALTSLARLEVVIALPTGASDALSAALAWSRARPGTAVSVVADRARARAALLNQGLTLVRAPSVAVLEPGDELDPSYLKRLIGMLAQTPAISVAYSILQVREPGNGEGDSLANCWPWDPARLRKLNCITTPYVARREALLAIGAFGTGPGLDGLEDYDLMCRLAASGYQGGLVHEILGRILPRPALAAPLLDEDAWRIAERAPALFSTGA